MGSKRNLLLLALLFVSFMLFNAWNLEKNPIPVEQVAVTTTAPASGVESDFSNTVSNSSVPAESSNVGSTETIVEGKSVILENDELRLAISLTGGDIISADLLNYDAELNSNTPFRLLYQNADSIYIAQSGLVGHGPDSSKNGRPVYKASNETATLEDGKNTVSTSLRFVDEKGNVFIKTFTLKRGDFVVTVSYQIENNTDQDMNVQMNGQLKETFIDTSTNPMMPVYRGGAYSSDQTRYSKLKFDEIEEAFDDRKSLSTGGVQPITTTEGGWVAMLQHYFVSAWIPSANDRNELYSDIQNNKKNAVIGFKAPVKTIAAHSVGTVQADLWIGPKLQDKMALVGQHLDLTVDYGWLWFIAQPLYKLLLIFQGIVGNWGVAIILITFTVKGALYPLTKAQYTSMAKMRLLQPKIQELRDRCGDDKQKASKGMMELYKKEKVNPLGGCLPIFLQMPIFISLYWSLMESVGLRHAPFMLWIQDLSVQDPYYIMPILMGVSMFFIQKMSPTTVQDPMQQKVMQFMPIMFTFFFLWFPAGLVLYWLMSNVVTLVQQTLIYRNFEKKGMSLKK